MSKRLAAVISVLMLTGAQFGLAHALVCMELMSPPVAAQHCHGPETGAENAGTCQGMAGCSGVCQSLTPDWAATLSKKACDGGSEWLPGLWAVLRRVAPVSPTAELWAPSNLDNPSPTGGKAIFLRVGSLLI